MGTARKTVLIVDDDAASRKLLARYLKGFTLIEAEDGVAAWDLFLEKNPDVVISDLKMPQRDGLALFKMIRDHSPDTPVIILSGAGTMADVIETLRLGASDYLEKPLWSQEVVVHVVEKAFNMLRLEKIQRNYQSNLEQEVALKTAELRQELLAREEAESKLLQAQKEWKRTFDAMPDLIAIVDNDFNVLRANKAMAEAMNWDRNSGEACICYTEVHATGSPPPFGPHAKLQIDGLKHSVEIYEERLGGYFEITAVPYYSEDGMSKLGSVHIARNVDDRKRLEKEKEKMQVQFLHAQKLESVGQLAAGIAHEINTPIQFVSSNNDFLDESFQSVRDLITAYEGFFAAARDSGVTQKIKEKVAAARDDADWEYLEEEIPSAISQNQEGLQRVASIVRAMKEFSHPGSKEKEKRNLNEIIRTTGIVARNEWKYIADLEMDLYQSLPEVMCYSDDMGQVILNIIINAAHAIEEKLGENPETDKGVIHIATKLNGEYAEIHVRDTGVGMPQEMQQKIFDPFYTTKKVGKGTGQGLAIAWNIVKDKHDGELRVESEEGKGTTFIIRIPI